MNRPVPAAVEELIDLITTWPVGMPVRAMEQILVAQGKAVPLLAEALLRWQEDADRDLLWLIVLLDDAPAGQGRGIGRPVWRPPGSAAARAISVTG